MLYFCFMKTNVLKNVFKCHNFKNGYKKRTKAKVFFPKSGKMKIFSHNFQRKFQE